MEKSAAGAYASQLEENRIVEAVRQVQEQIESARRLNGPPLELPDGTPITASSKENETTLAFYVAKDALNGTGSGFKRTIPSKLPDANAVPKGNPAKIEKNASPEKIRALERENEAAKKLAEYGYDIEQNPKIGPADGIGLDKKPDFSIGGTIFDCYSPSPAKSVRGVWSEIRNKIEDLQTKRVVINLADWEGSIDDLIYQFKEWKIEGLEEAMIINKNGSILTIFP
jgi:hypothetical protein